MDVPGQMQQKLIDQWPDGRLHTGQVNIHHVESNQSKFHKTKMRNSPADINNSH